MQRFRQRGMKLTRKSVESFWPLIDREYRTSQAKNRYGTENPNGRQDLKSAYSADVLLRHFRTYKKSNGDVNTFLPPLADPIDDDIQASVDFCFVMQLLGKYACATRPSKSKIVEDVIKELEKVNDDRRKRAVLPIEIKIARTYERWIDKYLDRFMTCMQREGLAAAQREFGRVEEGRQATANGQIAESDAWRFHLVTLDVTREEYNRMSEEERAKVKKCHMWVTVIMDLATRCILGFSISHAPDESSALEALRMVYMDKTYLLRQIGIKESDWNFVCPVQEFVNDNGNEYGKDPFGGALFSAAVLALSGSQVNTIAGVSFLRGKMERFFWTSDQKWARYLPGYSHWNPQARNDRKHMREACLTHDELHILFTAFIAEYHKTPHRGLNFRTLAAVWQELSEGAEFDLSQMPSPGQIRTACGFTTTAKVREAGIRFAGNVYSNQVIRSLRRAKPVDRIAEPGQNVEIKVDPFDLGAISVVSNGEVISVPCLDETMRGKSLQGWEAEKRTMKLKIKAENLSQKDAQKEAAGGWKTLAETTQQHADIGVFGYTQAELDRAALELDFGKGQHEKPFVGADEDHDPVHHSGVPFAQDADDFEQEEKDPKTAMDRFRSPKRKNNTGKKRKAR